MYIVDFEGIVIGEKERKIRGEVFPRGKGKHTGGGCIKIDYRLPSLIFFCNLMFL